MGKTKDKAMLLRMTAAELKRIDELAELCGLNRTETIMECVKFSAHRVSKKYIKEFVQKALAMPDPFDVGGVFDPPPKSDAEFEDRVTEKCVALAKETKKPGSVRHKGRKTGERYRSGYSQAEFYASVDESDKELAEKTLK